MKVAQMMTDERERFFLAEFLPRLRCFLVDKGEPELLGEFCPVPYSAWTETEKGSSYPETFFIRLLKIFFIIIKIR